MSTATNSSVMTTDKIVKGSGTPSSGKFKFDPRWIAPVFVSLVIMTAQFQGGVVESWKFFATAVFGSLLLELTLGKIVYGKAPFLGSAWVSGNSVGILIHVTTIWPYALCAALSITSKYVFRFKGRHIWNPSNFGIAMMLLIAHDYMATLSVQAGNSIKPMMVIWCLGLFIVYRIKRLHITLTYVLTFVALSLVRSVLTHQDFLTAVGPLTGPMYQLFIFFMITDPKTTVSSTKGQILVAFLVGVVEAILRLMQNVHAPYFALFIVGPIANLAEIYLFPSKPKVTATPQPIAVPA